jgi:hypothetical protein
MPTAANSSLWWRDILGLAKGNNENRFKSNISCGVGDGKNIGFWKFKWFGDRPFSELFPDIFSKEADKDVLIAERVQGNSRDRVWSWNWRQQLSTSEQNHLEALKVLLLDFTFIPNAVDRWRWMTGTMGLFSVRSCYSLLSESMAAEVIDVNVLAAVKKLWKIDIPSKVLVFGWRLLLERLPTRSALNHRGILHHSQDLSCAFCSQQAEDIDHLFFICSFSKSVWVQISNWVGKNILTGAECWNNFMMFGKLISSKKGGGHVNRLIWLATTWCLWKHRNQVIFKGATPDATVIVNEVKSFSWFWFSSRFGRNSNSTYSLWCLDLLGCIISIL